MRHLRMGIWVCAIGVGGSWALGEDIRTGKMTAQEVANAFKYTNKALSEGIAAAERHVGGKAIDAECFGTADPAKAAAEHAVCMVTVLTADNKLVETRVDTTGRILGQANMEMAPGLTTTQLAMFNQNNVSVIDCLKAAERHVEGKAIQVEAMQTTTPDAQSASCMVTLLTPDNKLVKTSVTRTGQVLGKQNVEAITLGSGFAVAPGISTSNTTMAPRSDTVIRTSQRLGGEAASADEFTMPKRIQKASDLIGKDVTNSSNENLGELEDIVFDADSGRILYGVLSFGGFLGLGDKLFAIPASSLRLSPDFKNFVLNVDKEQLKGATGFDKQQWPNFADERWATTTYKFYNQTPYWENRPPVMGSPNDPNYDFRNRWYQKTVNWQKASSLIGTDVHNHKNEDIGEINDLVIDPDQGRVLYGVLSFRGKLFPAPYNAMQLKSDKEKVILRIDKEMLKDSIGFVASDWPNMLDPQWAMNIHNGYNVQPYWTNLERPRGNNP